MLLSMTGHGEAAGRNERIGVTIEVRGVNNRHLKVTVRCPDSFLALESNIERVVREVVTRGTLNISLSVRHLTDVASHHLNETLLGQYWRQLQAAAADAGSVIPSDIGCLLALPGVVDDGNDRSLEESDWPLIESVLSQALESFQEFRRSEGRVMGEELLSLAETVATHAAEIAQRAPNVVVEYRERLKFRINEALRENGVQVEDKDLVREVCLFADRCDITEELTRLRSHLGQYRALIAGESSNGRKLDFLGQELFREVNTIGSKANDIEISHRVVDMKAAVEKMREIIQNIE